MSFEAFFPYQRAFCLRSFSKSRKPFFDSSKVFAIVYSLFEAIRVMDRPNINTREKNEETHNIRITNGGAQKIWQKTPQTKASLNRKPFVQPQNQEAPNNGTNSDSTTSTLNHSEPLYCFMYFCISRTPKTKIYLSYTNTTSTNPRLTKQQVTEV